MWRGSFHRFENQLQRSSTYPRVHLWPKWRFGSHVWKILERKWETLGWIRRFGGDFNFFLNEDLDKESGRNSRRNHKHCKRLVTQFMSENDLIDIWRTLNPNRKQFTCLRQTPPSDSRIDVFLTTRSILEGVPHASIVEGYLTDHKMCCLDFNVARTVRGRSFWKFINSLLGDDTFISEGKIKIKEIIRENESELISKTTLPATVLCVLRGWIIQYASRKKRENEKKFRDIEEDLNDAVNNDLPADVIDAIREKRDGLITMVTKYNMLRCRTNWRQYAEKGTKYFHSLSKRGNSPATFHSLKLDIAEKGIISGDITKMLREAGAYFAKLYAKVQPTRSPAAFFDGLVRLQESTGCPISSFSPVFVRF